MDDPKLARLHRRLAAREGAQAVIRQPNDKLDLFPAASPRFAALLRSPVWARRVLGVFSPDVPIEVLRREVCA